MIEMDYNDFSNALLDLYSLRNVLPADIKAAKVDPAEDSDYTIGDLLDDVIQTLENYDGDED